MQAPSLTADGGAGLARLTAADGVLEMRLSEHTGNVLIEFDLARIDEPGVLALIRSEADSPSRPPPRPRSQDAQAPAPPGWLRATRSETVRARPAECLAVLLAFESYPEWQTYVRAVTVLEHDERGRPTRVTTRASVNDREIELTMTYHFPHPNQVAFAHEDGELGTVRGSWSFRSLGRGRTRVTHELELKPGWRLSLMLRGPLYEQLREAALDHVMGELRARVEDER